MSDDLPPDLEDFEEVIQKVKPPKEEPQTAIDYTKTTGNFYKQDVLEQEINQKINNLNIQEQQQNDQFKKNNTDYQAKVLNENKPKPQPKDFGGGLFKKGFLNQPEKKKTKIQQVKAKELNKNPLEIDEVQKSMGEMNNYMNKNKDQWLTKDFLEKVQNNDTLKDLFKNPEYLQAIGEMQKDPKATMQKYQHDSKFMMMLQEFTKIMGNQFSDISKKEELTNEQKQQQQKQKELEQKFQDPEVMEIMRDPMVMNIMKYLQSGKKIDLREVISKNPTVGQKIQRLKQKGIINFQDN